MIDLRDMQLLDALAQHRHFARAADACGISQPAFSGRIRNMEADFGVPLVQRGNRFLGLTKEGEVVLRWSRKMLADAEGMRQEIAALKGSLTGKLAIGAVPTALSFVAQIPAALRTLHPDLTLEIISASSTVIRRGLEDFSLDAGVSYIEGADLPGFRSVPLYDETYVLLAPPGIAPRTSGTATWAEAATLPLCLLTSDMNNRRIIDTVFAEVGAAPKPVMETNAFTAAFAQVASGAAATIAPSKLADSLPIGANTVRLALTEPMASRVIGLVTADRDPVPPAVQAMMTTAMAIAKRA
jgi:DNA-binding transcriptional LysR family regulator